MNNSNTAIDSLIIKFYLSFENKLDELHYNYRFKQYRLTMEINKICFKICYDISKSNTNNNFYECFDKCEVKLLSSKYIQDKEIK